MENQKLYGLLAEFESPEELLSAIHRAREEGYRRMDAYTPYPMEEVPEALHLRSSPSPWFVLAGAIAGVVFGFGMQYVATTIMLRWNIGGRPLDSWPAYIPITFEMMVLFATFAGLIGLFLLDGLPQPYHPVFNVPEFVEHGSTDHYFLAVEGRDLKFDRRDTRQFLLGLGAHHVSEVGV